MSTDTPGTSLAVRKPTALAATAYEPQNVADGYALAKYLAGSGMLGKDIKSPEQALTVMIAGRELGFTAMQSLRAIYIVEGRVTLSADAMVALVLRSPECEYLTLVSSTADECFYKTKRRGQDEVVMGVTAADAKTAGWGATHTKYPAIMKRHRAASNICRAVYPDVVLGMFSPEEMQDIADADRPEPVSPLPTAARQAAPEVLEGELVVDKTTGEVTDAPKPAVQVTPDDYVARFVASFNDCKHEADRVAVRAEAVKKWGKDIPAEVMAASKAAAERIKAGG